MAQLFRKDGFEFEAQHAVPDIDDANNFSTRDVVGNKSDTVAGDSLVALVKQVLAGGGGGAVSTVSTFAYLDAGGEQTIAEQTTAYSQVNEVTLRIDLRSMTQRGRVRLYHAVDGATFELAGVETVRNDFGPFDLPEVFEVSFTTQQPWRFSYEETADEGADRDIEVELIERPI